LFKINVTRLKLKVDISYTVGTSALDSSM